MKALIVMAVAVDVDQEDLYAWRGEQSRAVEEMRAERDVEGGKLVGADVATLVGEEVDGVAMRCLATLGIDTGELGPCGS